MTDYLLGTDDHELARLRLQHEVWGGVTDAFLDRIGVMPGQRCLDVGCGPGLVLASLVERVGPEGTVVGLDASGAWHEHLEQYREERGWKNVELVQARIDEWEGPGSGFDVVFLRWVLSFLPEPGRVIGSLRRLLAPGGVLAIQDYNHEGVSLFPPSAGFSAAVRATRELFAKNGGDTWIAGSLPRHLREAGLTLFDWKANVLTGRPGSPPFRWADSFFPRHSERMVREGVMLPSERELFLEEWEARKKNPDAVFFSPIVVDAAARR